MDSLDPTLIDPNGSRTKPQAKRQEIRAALREMIFDGRYPAGSRLAQQDLAQQLGASIGVIREVLVQLAGAGLVELRENHGFFVGQFDLAKLTDLLLVRAVHEGLAARLCCERAGRRDIRNLRTQAEEIFRLGNSNQEEDVRRATRLDRQMHESLVRLARSEVLLRAWQSSWLPMLVGRAGPKQCFERSHGEHMAFLEAIEQNRPDDAERLAREHIQHSLDYIRQRIEQGTAGLAWYV